MDSFKNLIAWQKGMELVEMIYNLTSKFPSHERFGLTSQLRRASTSVVANIAEGFGRYTFSDKNHHYVISRGELSEIETYLLCAEKIGFVSPDQIKPPLDQIKQCRKVLSGLISRGRTLANKNH